MKLIFTDHALLRMSIRRISKKMVEQTLAEPEQTGRGYKQRLFFYRSFGESKIKVVCTKEDGRYIIISVMWE